MRIPYLRIIISGNMQKTSGLSAFYFGENRTFVGVPKWQYNESEKGGANHEKAKILPISE